MHIERLKEFVTLASTQNYRAASEMLFISQSALTRHIKELEAQVGVRLFDRDTRVVAITHDGARILERAQMICDIYDGILLDFERQPENYLIVGVPVKFQFYSDMVRLAIERMRIEQSGFSCRVVDVGTSTEPPVSLEKGCDIVLDWGPERYTDGDLESVPLCERPISLWVSEDNPLAERASVSAAELKGMVFRPSTSDTRYVYHKIARSIFREGNVSPAVGEEADALYQLGPNDFALVHGGAPNPSFGFGAREVPFEEDFSATVSLTFRRQRNSPLLRSFIDALKRAALELDRADK